jgi:tRNA(adenine34) deaminase
MTDNDYMDMALRYAMEAFARGDWPVGSVIVRDGEALGSGQNRQNSGGDVTTHGELEAIRSAIGAHGAERITGATLYTTMEPCPMCAWALKLAGIRRLVLGTRHATLRRTDMGTYNIETFCELVGYSLEITNGVREKECTAMRRRWGKDIVKS